MKTILFFLLLALAVNSLNSQIPFAPIGAKYYTKTECPPFGGPPPILWEITVDSVIQGKDCTQINSGFTNQLGTLNDGNAFVHSDGYKVFIYDGSAEVFHLVYDFAKEKGESYRIKLDEYTFNTDSATVVVDDVLDIDYNNHPAVLQKLTVTSDNDSTGWWDDFTVDIYEGIGGLYGNRLLIPQWILITTDCFTQDLCYYSPLTGAVSLLGNDSQPCEPVAVRDEQFLSYFQISPNPSYGALFVQYDFPVNFHDVSVHLFDNTGRRSRTVKLDNQAGEISFSDLPSGVYAVAIVSEGQMLGAKKAVVLE